MKQYHPVHDSKCPWLVVSLDDQGMQVVHAQLSKKKEVDKVLQAYRKMHPTKNFEVVYRPKI
jgi:hypothetical protein